MANDDARNVDRVWELMKKIGFAMLVTRDGDKLRARPMSAYLQRDENAIYFLTDARRHKDDEIARNPAINLSFAEPSSQKYVSLAGAAAPQDPLGTERPADRPDFSCTEVGSFSFAEW